MKRQYPVTIKNRDLLYRLYIEQNLGSTEIGRLLSVDGRLIRTWLHNFHIPVRIQSQASKISAVRYFKKKVTTNCSLCGAEYEVHLYRFIKSKKHYCSRSCQIKDHKDSLGKAVEKHGIQHPRINKICPVCNKAFSVPFSHARSKYCSDRCKGVAHLLSLAGKRGPNKIESKVLNIIVQNKLQFQYNGNGELGVVLRGMVPDFVNTNGKKQVIEVFGDYYHNLPLQKWNHSELGRIMAYNSLGYQCLILWERDIRAKSDEELTMMLKRFTKRRVKEVIHG